VDDVVKYEKELPAESLLDVIARAVSDPRVDVEKMERILVMKERMDADQRKQAFKAAMARLQAKLPQVQKDGRIVVKGQERSRYARIEDIDLAVKPLLAEEGFAFSFNTESKDPNNLLISAELSHRDGYSEMKSLLLPIDKSDFRSNVQSIGSTVSYGKRQLIKMHLNLVERGEDDDGQGGSKLISEDQAKDLEAMITEVGADKARFLAYMDAGSVESILARDLPKAIAALEAKRRRHADIS
jgi:hypothetical protein